jgi:hypothetical protein
MRKVDEWQSHAEKPSDQIIDLAARCGNFIIPSLDGGFTLTLQADGNLVPAFGGA